MDKKYQVFVSSTFKDLEEERQEVMHALLELDCMPAGMELFPAANESQWNLIKRVIDDSDYYILILAGRYGSTSSEGISYTEMEYRYALSTGKPTIAFLHRNPGKISAENSESSDEGKRMLGEFRKLVENRLCKHWDTAQELGSVVSRSLIQLIKSTPAIGWVRANEIASQEATLELLNLKRRIEELQNELARSRTTAPKGTEGLAQGNEKVKINFNFKSTPPDDYEYQNWKSTCETTWNDLFSSVAPLMISEATEQQIKAALDSMMQQINIDDLYKREEFKNQRITAFSLEKEDFQTIKIQFRALGLITQSEKARSVKDSATYWKLTPYGDEEMTKLRAIRSKGLTSAGLNPKITEE